MLSLALLVATTGIQLAAASGSCNGPDTAIVSTHPFAPTTDAKGLSTYKIAVKVSNVGASQPGNALDSVVMYLDGRKTDQKGLNPLAAGASQSVTFSFQRNVDAAAGSTSLRFEIVHSPATVECNPANDTSGVRL